jgi:hypothetical protein
MYMEDMCTRICKICTYDVGIEIWCVYASIYVHTYISSRSVAGNLITWLPDEICTPLQSNAQLTIINNPMTCCPNCFSDKATSNCPNMGLYTPCTPKVHHIYICICTYIYVMDSVRPPCTPKVCCIYTQHCNVYVHICIYV